MIGLKDMVIKGFEIQMTGFCLGMKVLLLSQ